MKVVKKLFITFLIIALLMLLYSKLPKSQETKNPISQIIPLKSSPKNKTEIDLNKITYEAAFFKAQASQVSLYSNLQEKLSSGDLVKAKSCKSLINAGFYTKNDKPTGLFISEGKTIEYHMRSELFNGIYSITFDDKAKIAATFSQGSTKYAVQSGPLLLVNSTYQKLKLKNDEPARRSVAAQDSSGSTWFLSIYDKNSNFLGPYLADLPAVLQIIADKLNVNFTDAINLDGGSASAFYSDQISISELTLVGSYFCIK